MLVRRGNCWFHSKALHAQAAGAVAVIVYNDKQAMVSTMEGIEDLPAPRIPTLLVDTPIGRS